MDSANDTGVANVGKFSEKKYRVAEYDFRFVRKWFFRRFCSFPNWTKINSVIVVVVHESIGILIHVAVDRVLIVFDQFIDYSFQVFKHDKLMRFCKSENVLKIVKFV